MGGIHTLREFRSRRRPRSAWAVQPGSSRKDGTASFWIDQRTFLIRRIEERYVLGAESRADQERTTREMLEQGKVSESMRVHLQRFLERDLGSMPDSHVTSVTTYRPVVDAEIEPERFAFSPPFVGPAAWEMP
jgi:hypothetical protein